MKILALQLKRIGDLILTTPALHALKAAGGQISLAVLDNTAPLLPAMADFVDEPFVFRRGKIDPAFWLRMWRGRWDACLDFTGNDRSGLLTAMSGARQRLIARDALYRASYWRRRSYTKLIDTLVVYRHTVDRFLDYLPGIGLPGASADEPASPVLRLSAEAIERPRQMLAACGLNEGAPYIVIHPGSARSEKYWLPERWAEVIRYIHRELGLPCILTGGRGDPLEDAHLARIRTRAADAPLIDLAGKLDLLALGAVIQGARLYAGVDSGPMHLAAAMRRPLVVLFGPTTPFVWRPRHPGCLILQAGQGDRPLTQFDPRTPTAPMDLISTDAVTGCIAASFPQGILDVLR